MKRALVVVMVLVAAGCSVGPKYQRPDVTVPSAYREAPPEQ